MAIGAGVLATIMLVTTGAFFVMQEKDSSDENPNGNTIIANTYTAEEITQNEKNAEEGLPPNKPRAELEGWEGEIYQEGEPITFSNYIEVEDGKHAILQHTRELPIDFSAYMELNPETKAGPISLYTVNYKTIYRESLDGQPLDADNAKSLVIFDASAPARQKNFETANSIAKKTLFEGSSVKNFQFNTGSFMQGMDVSGDATTHKVSAYYVFSGKGDFSGKTDTELTYSFLLVTDATGKVLEVSEERLVPFGE